MFYIPLGFMSNKLLKKQKRPMGAIDTRRRWLRVLGFGFGVRGLRLRKG